jgi:hypothetical protein
MYRQNVIIRKTYLNIFFVGVLSVTKIAGPGPISISQRHGSADPDPNQNGMDPEHCF